MRPTDEPLSDRELAAYLEGELARSEAAEIEAALRTRPEARQRLDRLDELRRALADLPDELAGVDLVAGVRHAIAGAPPRPARGRRALGGAVAVAASAALALALWPRGGAPGRDVPGVAGVRDKAAGSGEAGDRWVRLEVFQLDGGVARPLAAGATVRSDAALAFRYTDLGSAPFGYLIVLGIDAAREVRWYYPAYETADSDPRSLAIRPGEVGAALPDAIAHELPPGPLVIYGVFSRAPLRVRDVDRRVTEQLAGDGWDPAAPPRLSLAGSGQDMIRVNVIR